MKKRKNKHSDSAKLLQVKSIDINKTKNARREYYTKSKDIFVVLTFARLDYYLNNNFPISAQSKNGCCFFSNYKILSILHRTAQIIHTFAKVFIVSYPNKMMCVSPLVKEGKKLVICLM